MLEKHLKFLDTRNIIPLLLLWTVLRPSTVELLNLPAERTMDLFQTGLLFFLWIIILLWCRFQLCGNFIMKLFILIFVFQIFSFFWGTCILGYKHGIRDFYELYRFPYFYLVYGLVYQIDIQENGLKKYVLNPILLCFAVEHAIVIFFHFDIFAFKKFASLIYYQKFQDKMQGTFQNANWLGVFLLFGLMIVGMLAREAYNSLVNGRAFNWTSLALAAIVSPIVFGGIYGSLGNLTVDVPTTVLAFQNGFFWNSIFEGIKQGTSDQSTTALLMM